MSLNNFFEFIPTAIHYDNNTLMTKSGELIQIIEIKGYAERFNINNFDNLREVIRRVLSEILSKDIMFFLYVKRDYTKLDNKVSYSNEYGLMIHDKWLLENNLQSILLNTLYIAVIHKGSKSFLSIKNIILNITFEHLTNNFQAKLEHGQKMLSDASMKILQATEAYGGKLLKVKYQNNQIISEPLSFIHYLTYCQSKDIELSSEDYSRIIAKDLRIQIMYNVLKNNTEDESNIYTSVLSLKAPYKLSTFYTDKILNLDQKMIITETIRLVNKKCFNSKLNDLKSWYEMSGMQVGIESVQADLEALTTEKAILSQITMMILGSSAEELSNNMKKTHNLMCELGISTVREDFYILGSKFSILPGNGHFFRREVENITDNSAIFSSIKPKSLGGYNGSQWGKPITLFMTIEGFPYFFNFHNKNSVGHTIVLGSKDNGADILTEFLMLESLKFNLKIIDFYSQEDNIFTKISCTTVVNDDAFSIDMVDIINKDLKEFCNLFHFILQQEYSEDSQLYLTLNRIYNIILEDIDISTKVANILSIIESHDNPLNSNLKSSLLKIFSDKCFFKILNRNNQIDDNIWNVRIKKYIDTLDLSANIKNNLLSTIIFLFIKKINQEVFVSNIYPIIIRVDSTIFNIPSNKLDEYKITLLEIAKKGIMLLINCNDKMDLYKLAFAENIIQSSIPTRFFLSEKLIAKQFSRIFQLSQKDLNAIKMYHPKECIFLLQQDDYSISASFKTLNNFYKL